MSGNAPPPLPRPPPRYWVAIRSLRGRDARTMDLRLMDEATRYALTSGAAHYAATGKRMQLDVDGEPFEVLVLPGR